MIEYSSVENPTSRSSKIRSKMDSVFWSPEGLKEMKLLCYQGIQFEIFFRIINDDISIIIRRTDHNNFIKCYLFYCLWDGCHKLSVKEKDNFFKHLNINDTFDVSTSFKASELLDSKFKIAKTFHGNILTSIIVDKQSCIPKRKTAGSNNSHKRNRSEILDSLLLMYDKGIHSDVKLQIGNETFSAHKCILASRSPIFSAMFDQDMVEKRSGIVIITDMDANTLNSLLKYLYSNIVEDLNFERTIKLLLAAEKYQVFSLREKCAASLVDFLSVENACEVLVVADMLSHQNLKSKAVDYIKMHADKVLFSEAWKQLVKEYANLGAEVLGMISKELGGAMSRLSSKKPEDS